MAATYEGVKTNSSAGVSLTDFTVGNAIVVTVVARNHSSGTAPTISMPAGWTGYGGTGNPGPVVESLADVGAVLAGEV